MGGSIATGLPPLYFWLVRKLGPTMFWERQGEFPPFAFGLFRSKGLGHTGASRCWVFRVPGEGDWVVHGGPTPLAPASAGQDPNCDLSKNSTSAVGNGDTRLAQRLPVKQGLTL